MSKFLRRVLYEMLAMVVTLIGVGLMLFIIGAERLIGWCRKVTNGSLRR